MIGYVSHSVRRAGDQARRRAGLTAALPAPPSRPTAILCGSRGCACSSAAPASAPPCSSTGSGSSNRQRDHFRSSEKGGLACCQRRMQSRQQMILPMHLARAAPDFAARVLCLLPPVKLHYIGDPLAGEPALHAQRHIPAPGRRAGRQGGYGQTGALNPSDGCASSRQCSGAAATAAAHSPAQVIAKAAVQLLHAGLV
jgi:hypothetical protein